MAQPLPGRPLPTIGIVLYSVLLAVIVPFVITVLFARISAAHGFDDGTHSGLAAERSHWDQISSLYFLVVLPLSLLIGLIAGVLWGRSRRRPPGVLTHDGPLRFPPLHAALIGGASGACLLVMAAFALALFDGNPNEFFDLSSILQVTSVGAVGGAVIGLAAWIALTPRLVHPFYIALACGVLGAVISTLLFLGYLALSPASSGSGGHGNYLAGLEWLLWYLIGVLPTSIILGMIVGAILGSVRRARRLAQEAPQFRVE